MKREREIEIRLGGFPLNFLDLGAFYVKKGVIPHFSFHSGKQKMPMDFKLNYEPLSEGKEARYAVCTGYEKKKKHTLI